MLGCLAWIITIFLVRHPIRHEVVGVVEMARQALAPSLRFGRS
jgi:hypothetical protein